MLDEHINFINFFIHKHFFTKTFGGNHLIFVYLRLETLLLINHKTKLNQNEKKLSIT